MLKLCTVTSLYRRDSSEQVVALVASMAVESVDVDVEDARSSFKSEVRWHFGIPNLNS